MPAKTSHKTEYLHIRISPQVKGLMEKKAERLGMSASEYVRLLIMEDARHMLDEEDEQTQSE